MLVVICYIMNQIVILEGSVVIKCCIVFLNLIERVKNVKNIILEVVVVGQGYLLNRFYHFHLSVLWSFFNFFTFDFKTVLFSVFLRIALFLLYFLILIPLFLIRNFNNFVLKHRNLFSCSS